MIGFPLQLPIEASAPRNFRLIETYDAREHHAARGSEYESLNEFVMTLSDAEVKALRAWMNVRPAPAESSTHHPLQTSLQIAGMCELISTANFDRDDLGHRNTADDDSDLLMRDLLKSGLATLSIDHRGPRVSAELQMFGFSATYVGRQSSNLNDAILATWQREARNHLAKARHARAEAKP
ncbi:hypothetical protein [Cypionkella sp.]|uniref:hypothetical protein n=1 Tax=Cypionkella sp. TaxID=2811411 RepID=UPI002ABBC9A5|nr:hypothetical protein [Cypionkella sp.]MDZ4393795.1 hypothetical protein [Cypionkella sp.]